MFPVPISLPRKQIGQPARGSRPAGRGRPRLAAHCDQYGRWSGAFHDLPADSGPGGRGCCVLSAAFTQGTPWPTHSTLISCATVTTVLQMSPPLLGHCPSRRSQSKTVMQWFEASFIQWKFVHRSTCSPVELQCRLGQLRPVKALRHIVSVRPMEWRVPTVGHLPADSGPGRGCCLYMPPPLPYLNPDSLSIHWALCKGGTHPCRIAKKSSNAPYSAGGHTASWRAPAPLPHLPSRASARSKCSSA